MVDFNGINPNYGIGWTGPKPAGTDKPESAQPGIKDPGPKTDYKSADQVLDFMANAGIVVPEKKPESADNKGKVIPVSNYVSPEDAKNIRQSVNECISFLFSAEEEAIKEFGLSPAAAQNLAVTTFEDQFLTA